MWHFSGTVRIKDKNEAMYRDKLGRLNKTSGNLVPYDVDDIYLLKTDKDYELFFPASMGKLKGVSLKREYKETEEKYLSRIYTYSEGLVHKSVPVFWRSGETTSLEGLAIPAFDTRYGQFYSFVRGTDSSVSHKRSDEAVIVLDRRTGVIELRSNKEVVLSMPTRYKGGDPRYYPLAIDDLMTTAALYVAQSKINKDKMFGIVKEDGHTYLSEISINSDIKVDVLAEYDNVIEKVSVARQPFIKILYHDDATASISGAYLGPSGQMICMGGPRVPTKDIKDTILYQSVEMLWHIDHVKEKIGDNPNLQMFGASSLSEQFMDNVRNQWENFSFLNGEENGKQSKYSLETSL